MTNIIFSEDVKIIGRKADQFLSISVIETPISVGGLSTSKSTLDLEYNELVGGDILEHADISFTNITNDINAVLSSSNPAIASISGHQIFDTGIGGTVDIYINHYGYAQQKITRTYGSPPAIVKDSTGYVVGTLGDHILANVEALISGLTPSKTIQNAMTRLSSDIDNPSIELNPYSFVNSLDFSATSVMRSSQPDDRYPLALITDQHAIVAKHVKPSVGEAVVFRRANGTYQKAFVSVVTNLADDYRDLAVVYLDVPITGITPYKTLPYGWIGTYTPATINGYYNGIKGIIPTIRKSQHYPDGTWGTCFVINTISQSDNAYGGGLNNTRLGIVQSGEIPESWGIAAIGGDSGSPSFLLINGEPIILCTQYLSGSSEDIAGVTTEINTIMNTQASAAPGVYILNAVDLSGFITYP